jgi:CRISPR-associated protein Csb2
LFKLFFNGSYAVFKLLHANGDAYRYTHAKLLHVARMVRHAAIAAMDPDKGNPPAIAEPKKWVDIVVAGHRDLSCELHEQFSYVPLPSIGHEHADALIRRVMIVAPFSQDAHLRHLTEQLNGVRLTPEETTPTTSRPILDGIRPDNVTQCYLATADTWHTVTPVILPGRNDHNPGKTRKLIQRALQQSGIETSCEFL